MPRPTDSKKNANALGYVQTLHAMRLKDGRSLASAPAFTTVHTVPRPRVPSESRLEGIRGRHTGRLDDAFIVSEPDLAVRAEQLVPGLEVRLVVVDDAYRDRDEGALEPRGFVLDRGAAVLALFGMLVWGRGFFRRGKEGGKIAYKVSEEQIPRLRRVALELLHGVWRRACILQILYITTYQYILSNFSCLVFFLVWARMEKKGPPRS